jgi:hypothetical protein
MRMLERWSAVLTVVIAVAAIAGPAVALAEEAAAEDKQKVAIEGTYVRIGYNDEGWVTMGFRTANNSVGQEWMLLEVGLTVQKGVADYTLKRSDIALVAPGPKVVPLATQTQFQEAGYLRALNERANIARDSVNYFPPSASRACAINFFANPAGGVGGRLSRDVVDLSQNRACAGRLFFHIPDGVQLGLYNLDVKFANSTIRLPFKIMTKDEAKEFEKEWKAARKQAKKEKKEKK